jgi:hypothetical protein
MALELLISYLLERVSEVEPLIRKAIAEWEEVANVSL